MTRVDLDGGATLKKLRGIYATLCKADQNTIETVNVEDARSVSNSPEKYSTGTRKLAAQLLIRCDPSFVCPKDWVQLAAVVDSETSDSLVAIARCWRDIVGRKGIESTDDEFLFLSCFIVRVAKFRKEIEATLGQDEYQQLRRMLFSTCVVLYEVRSEDVSHLFKAVIKLYADECAHNELLHFCLYSMSLVMPAGLFTLGLLLTNNKDIVSSTKDASKVLLQHVPRWAECQMLSTSAAPLLCVLLETKDISEEVVDCLMRCLLSRRSNVRSNIVRCFLGRVTAKKDSLPMFLSLVEALKQRWEVVAERSDDDFWPPQLWETEDHTCIDVQWQWEEGEDVYWYRDRIIHAYLSVWAVVLKKFKNTAPEQDDKIINLALRWHLPELRLAAFELFRTSKNLNQDVIEEFLIANYTTSNADLESCIRSVSSNFTFSEVGKEKWDELCVKGKQGEEHGKGSVFLPDDVSCSPVRPVSDAEVPSRISSLLKMSGSHEENICPTFPVLYNNLEAAGVNHRVFTKQITDLMKQLTTTSIDGPNSIAYWLWEAITRCRMKAVVDQGSTYMEELFVKHPKIAEAYFEKAITRLLCPTSTVRTLCVSRVLWSCCSVCPQLFSTIWDRVHPAVNVDTSPVVLSRVLKTMKLFYSKATCQLPKDSTYDLFWFCLDVQDSSDYLVRSSATILFGFLVRSMTSSRKMSLFSLIAKQRKLWNELCQRFSGFANLSVTKRVLILSFLKNFTLENEIFYGEHTLNSLSLFREQIDAVLTTSPDIRERRFCIDVLVQLTPSETWTTALERAEMIPNDLKQNARVDRAYLIQKLKRCVEIVAEDRLHDRLPVDLSQSPYVKRVEQSRSVALRWKDAVNEEELAEQLDSLRKETILGHELSAQSAATILCQLANGIKGRSISSYLAHSFLSECLRLISHPVPRVSSILSRVPVYLGISTGFLHDVYLEKELRSWTESSDERLN